MRCKACDVVLDFVPLSEDLCTFCQSASKKNHNAGDQDYDHSSITGVPTDGSTLSTEDWYVSEE